MIVTHVILLESLQESLTFSANELMNFVIGQNMRVRVLGGKTFCSRTGRMVLGEMKNKFLLVDLETVILGSYRSAAPSRLLLNVTQTW